MKGYGRSLHMADQNRPNVKTVLICLTQLPRLRLICVQDENMKTNGHLNNTACRHRRKFPQLYSELIIQ